MPFDGSQYEGRNPALDKMDRVIDLLGDERRWCKGFVKTPDGRYCILGAMQAVLAELALAEPILLAISQVTGRHQRIDRFNDHPFTTHALVVKVLWQARENIVNGAARPAQQGIGTRALFRKVFGTQRELV